jgi:hypothetical protein
VGWAEHYLKGKSVHASGLDRRGLAEQVRSAEQALRAANHSAIEDAAQSLPDQSARLRAWSADRDGLSPESAADLDRTRSQEMWSHRYGLPVEGSPIAAAGDESLSAMSDALRERFGEVDLRRMPKPGTQEFMEKYCQPPEQIERVVPHGPEGFGTIRSDVDGKSLGEGVRPLKLEGPGPARGTPEYAEYDHTPKGA